MMISAAMKFKLLTLATKYGVEIEHFSPGSVAASIASWRQFEKKFISIIEELRNDPSIYKVIWDQGYVEVQYDSVALNDPLIINGWLQILERYSF